MDQAIFVDMGLVSRNSKFGESERVGTGCLACQRRAESWPRLQELEMPDLL